MSAFSPSELPITQYEVTVTPNNPSNLNGFNVNEGISLSKAALGMNALNANQQYPQAEKNSVLSLFEDNLQCIQKVEGFLNPLLPEAVQLGVNGIDYMMTTPQIQSIGVVSHGLMTKESKFKPLDFDAKEIVKNPKDLIALLKNAKNCNHTPKTTIKLNNFPGGSFYEAKNLANLTISSQNNQTETITASIQDLEKEITFIVINKPFNRWLFKTFLPFIQPVPTNSQKLVTFCLGIIAAFTITVLTLNRKPNSASNINIDTSMNPKNTNNPTNNLDNNNQNMRDYYEQSGNLFNGHMSGGEIKENDKVGAQFNEAPKTELAEAAKSIQALLEQLDKSYPTDTTKGKLDMTGEILNQLEIDISFRDKIQSAFKAGGASALKKLLDHPAASFVIDALKDWDNNNQQKS